MDHQIDWDAHETRVLKELSESQKARLHAMSNVARDDSLGEDPGSERADEEERIFLTSALR